MFKKDPIKYKQPQEHYCSNFKCLNEVAQFNELSKLLTDEAFDNLSYFFCMDCIIEGNTNG